MENEFQKEVLQRLTKIETKMDNLQDVRDKAYSADSRSKKNEEDISDIQDSFKWLWRTVVGTIIAGVIGIAFFYIQN